VHESTGHRFNDAQISEESMKLPRRRFLHLAASAVASPFLSRTAGAQSYPARPVRLLVGFLPGGNNDIHARLIAQWLTERLGQPFIVENRAGAGGNLATESVVRAAPDGYTLLQSASNDSWNAALYDNLKFDYVRDVAPVAGVSRTGAILLANPSLPVKSVPDLISYAKANPSKLTVGSAGIGSAPHVFWQLFKNMTGTDIQHVPYRGGGPAYADLLAGRIHIFFGPTASSIEYVRSNKLRALGITLPERSEALPEIPAIAEFVHDYEGSGWQGVVAPKNTPVEIVEKLNREISAGLSDPKIKARFADLSVAPLVTSPAEFRKFIVEYTEKWGRVIRSGNIRAE
jgi:tripartite-type tricarboxylate transporter receptor subunit TctC